MNCTISFEVMPRPDLEAQIKWLPQGSLVGVTCSAKRGIETTIKTAIELQELGFEVSAHINARLIKDEAHLRQILSRLQVHQITDVLLIAGDSKTPTGLYESSLEILNFLAKSDTKIRSIGVAGYPGGHPFLDEKNAKLNLLSKQSKSTEMGINMYILTQMCGEAKIIIDWTADLRENGINLPVLVGIPGPVSNEKVLRIARKIGAEKSFQNLKQPPSQTFNTRALIQEILDDLHFEKLNVQGFQIFTFNEIAANESKILNWINEQYNGAYSKIIAGPNALDDYHSRR